jgi:hypothetical protein
MGFKMNNTATAISESLHQHFTAQARKEPSPAIMAIAAKSSIMALGPEWAPAFAALNNEVREKLAPDQKHYLKPRTVESLVSHTEARMPMIGIVTQGNCLIGGMLISYPHLSEKEHIAGYPLGTASNVTALAQSVMIKDIFAGCGLSSSMLDQAAGLAAATGYAYMMAKICDTNTPSRNLFSGEGYKKKIAHYFDDTGEYPYWASFWTRVISAGSAPKLRRSAQPVAGIR